ncbi:CHD3-type chromatin-remodeling factor PICKLE [Platanthera zijinensis]|uniref:CHD3-type chromatin-remodeling factor PICKLE n=1 Tax=Platanthera zijinensis TaxID=2320716 RepID=A0AAP0BZ24_9ASPA
MARADMMAARGEESSHNLRQGIKDRGDKQTRWGPWSERRNIRKEGCLRGGRGKPRETERRLRVHRILGCRVKTESSCSCQSTEIINSKEDKKAKKKAGKKSEKKAEKESDKRAECASVHTNFPFCDFTSKKNLDQVDCFDDNEVVDVKLGHAMDKDFHGDANMIAQKISGSSIELDKKFTDEMCKTSENIDKKEGPLTLMSQPSQVHCIDHEDLQLGDDCAGDTNAGELTSKMHVVRSIHTASLCAENHNEHHIPRPTDLPVNSESQEFCSYEFFVKWVGKSNIHNTWVSEDELKVLAKRKLENYKVKWGVSIINLCEEQWCLPQRIISIHESDNGGGEALVKWLGLPYDECTWERLDEPIIKNSSHLVSELKQFEFQTLDKDDIADIVRTDIQKIAPLAEQPKELKGGSLFPHQLEALNWLRKCWHKSKNVILADEMGLGKTVSACSFISSLFFEFKVKLPCLVLVPLSTMPNWQAEFTSWAPHLNIVEYHGSAKARSVIRQYEWHASDAKRPSKLSKEYKFNVLLTTYEMILADFSHLRGVSWEVLIVDEGHRLKNSESKLFNLLNTFSFQQCVLLTGTPLQNNLGEMYNLLNFLQPCSFPSLSSFEEKFNDLSIAEKVEELKKLVAPHMLRRLKKDAMQDIPPKSERLVPVELTSIQAEYYRAMLTKNYQILRSVGKGVAQQSMLNIVMQLRKVCNHPYLIPGTEPESSSLEFLQEMRIKASAKFTLLHSMLKILHKEGHRVLIFSQMTKLLDILEDYLSIEFGLGTFERVDGSVSVANRQAAITRFNQDKTRFVFLLSTRSCGLGINLATANTVIIYDSDFNPHADIQAMNRAHRIGQSNRLLVYRFVVRASVEERILQLAKKKLILDQLFVNKFGSQKEVEDILRWGTEELFSDSDGGNFLSVKNDCNNNVTATDGEHKHKRRSGGLGDIYKDRCTDVGNKITWDESSILKLLDRSNLQSGISENDGDLENGMLGAVNLYYTTIKLFHDEEPVDPHMLGSDVLNGIVCNANN